MKKIALLSAAAVLLTLSACGGTGEQEVTIEEVADRLGCTGEPDSEGRLECTWEGQDLLLVDWHASGEVDPEDREEYIKGIAEIGMGIYVEYGNYDVTASMYAGEVGNGFPTYLAEETGGTVVD